MTLAGELRHSRADADARLPTATPSPTPAADVDAEPEPDATAPTPTPVRLADANRRRRRSPIVEARQRPVGTSVTVAGVVIAEAGRLGKPALVAIADSTGGIAVRLPDGASAPPRGTLVSVTGPLADPYGQLELRPTAAGFRATGQGPLPAPRTVDGSTLGEGSEGALVSVTGSSMAADEGDERRHHVLRRPRAGPGPDRRRRLERPDRGLRLGRSGVQVIGIAGQRASRKGAADGYRVWPRDLRDIVRRSAAPTPAPPAGGAPKPTASAPAGGVTSIADAVRRGDGDAAVEGLVTAPADLLDSTGRRIIVEDRTAAMEVLLPTDGAVPPLGRTGPRQRGDRAAPTTRHACAPSGSTCSPWVHDRLPATLTSPPTAAQEWRLVILSGVVTDVHKLGDRWRAEVSLGGQSVVVNGLSGARIEAATILEGRRATVIGIVRRPYPGASDRRWSVVPRGPGDVVIGGAATGGAASGSDGSSSGGSGGSGGAGEPGSNANGVPDVDLVALADHVGLVVRVGGLVTELTPDGFLLDDGTAIGTIVLVGEAAEYLPLIEPGDALNATGRVEADGTGFRIVVDEAAGLVRVGDPNDSIRRARGGRARIGPAGRRHRWCAAPRRRPVRRRRARGCRHGRRRPAQRPPLAITGLRRHRARRLLAARVGRPPGPGCRGRAG